MGSQPTSWMPYVAAGIGAAAAAMWFGFDQMVSGAVGIAVGAGGGYYANTTFTPEWAYTVGAGGAGLMAAKYLGWNRQLQIVGGAGAAGAVYYYECYGMPSS